MTIPLESPPAHPSKAWVTLLTNPEYVASEFKWHLTMSMPDIHAEHRV